MNEENTAKVRALIEKFYEDRKMKGYSGETEGKHRWGLKYLLDFLRMQDEENLSQITTETLNKFQMHIYASPGRSGKALHLEAQSNVLSSTRALFQWLTQRNYLLADPASGLEMPKRRRTLPRGVMSVREIKKILAVPNVDMPLELRDRAMMEVLYCTGIRNKEIRNLKVYDVNLEEGQIHVQQGKGGDDRIVPLGEIASKYVELYLKEARPKILRYANRKRVCEDPGYLFLNKRKKKMDKSILIRRIGQYAKKAKLNKKITPHSFRHTCATHLLKGHANIRHIQAILGHKSLDSTQIYTHVETGDLKRELKRCHPRERAC